MKKLIPLLFLVSNISLAYEYELVNFSGSRVRTIEEILQETNKTEAQLFDYKCDNEERFELFSNSLIQNLNKDSLRIIDKNKNTFIYKDSELLNIDGTPVKKIRDRFVKTLLKTLERLESFPESKRLVEELQFAKIPFYIQLGGNRYSPHIEGERPYMHGNEAGFVSSMDDLKPVVDKLPFLQIGFGGIIYWDPKTDADFMESDGVMRKIDTDIILAHEMYHAYDGMRGLLDRRFVQSNELEFQPVCEFRAVRMENTFRKALGYKYRKFYSYSETDPKNMLDENGEPVTLPTPCIQWLK